MTTATVGIVLPVADASSLLAVLVGLLQSAEGTVEERCAVLAGACQLHRGLGARP